MKQFVQMVEHVFTKKNQHQIIQRIIQTIIQRIIQSIQRMTLNTYVYVRLALEENDVR